MPAYESISSTTWTSRTNTTVTAPSGITDGDLLLGIFAAGAASAEAPDPTPPSGFTALSGSWPIELLEYSFNLELRVYSKIAASESGDYTFTHATCESQGVIVRYSSPGGFDPAPTLNQGTGTTTTATGLTTTSDNSLVIFINADYIQTAGTMSPPSGTTPTFTERLDSATAPIYVADGVLAAEGATGNKTTTNRGSESISPWAAVLIALTPVVVEQEGFRWRNDDGDEDAATWRQSQDVADTAELDEQVRLRVLLNASGDPATTQYQLQYKQDSEAASLWRAIGVGAPGSTPTVVGWGSAALSTNDPSVNLSSGSWTPAENDVVVFFIASTTVLDLVVDGSLPTGWFGVLGSGVDVNSDAHGYCAVYHKVTAGEVGGGTTFTCTDALAAAETGNVVGVAVRGVDPSAVIHKAGSTFDSANTVTPSVLAALTGANQPTMSGCLVLRGVSQDSTGSYSDPASHTNVTSNNTNQINQVWTRDAATTAASDVAATNVTPDAGDEYCAITIAFTPAPGTPEIIYATSTQYADGDATTFQLTAPSGKTTSDFDAGVMVEGQALADTVNITADDYTEIEWCLKAQTPAVATDVYEFRVTANGTALATYTVTPELTVADGGTNAPAGNAAATGAAGSVTAKVSPSAGHASATGAAADAAPAVAPSAGHASATGAAGDATSKVSPSAGHASATGAAFDATVDTGAAETNADAGHASATGAASDAQASVAPSAGHASATGAASDATTKVSPTAGHASATGTAYDATAATGSFTNAPAELAAATGAAGAPTAKVSPTAELASATGTASDASSSIAPAAGHASATGAAFDASVAIAVSAGAAFATAVAYVIAARISPTAGHASATGTAYQAAGSDGNTGDLDHAITRTIRDRGHTTTINATGHTATIRNRGHTTTVREQHR
jgi:hypothetical protein